MPPIPPPRESGFTSTTAAPSVLGALRHARRAAVARSARRPGSGPLLSCCRRCWSWPATTTSCFTINGAADGPPPTIARRSPGGRTSRISIESSSELHVDPLDYRRLLVGRAARAPLRHRVRRGENADRAEAPRADRPCAREPRIPRRLSSANSARRQSDPSVATLRAELAASDLRESDPAAYRHRAFELSVAGYFAEPSAARDLTPFRVVGRVQQSVWDSLGDFDLLRPGGLDTVRVPTLIAHGRQDPIPLASSEMAARAMGSDLVVIEHCGHVPVRRAAHCAVRGDSSVSRRDSVTSWTRKRSYSYELLPCQYDVPPVG